MPSGLFILATVMGIWVFPVWGCYMECCYKCLSSLKQTCWVTECTYGHLHSMDRGAWWTIVHRVTKVRHNLVTIWQQHLH